MRGSILLLLWPKTIAGQSGACDAKIQCPVLEECEPKAISGYEYCRREKKVCTDVQNRSCDTLDCDSDRLHYDDRQTIDLHLPT